MALQDVDLEEFVMSKDDLSGADIKVVKNLLGRLFRGRYARTS